MSLTLCSAAKCLAITSSCRFPQCVHLFSVKSAGHSPVFSSHTSKRLAYGLRPSTAAASVPPSPRLRLRLAIASDYAVAMGKSQRTKGHNFERWVVRTMAESGWVTKRLLQYQEGHDCPDVTAYCSASTLAIECKVGARPDLFAALAQAESQDPGYGRPMVIAKKDRSSPVVVMRLSEFLEIGRAH